MKYTLLALPLALVLGSGAAYADGDRCPSAAGERQPETALREKLEAQGWQVRRIKVDDGCYEVYALDADGRRLEDHYDPRTLDRVALDGDD